MVFRIAFNIGESYCGLFKEINSGKTFTVISNVGNEFNKTILPKEEIYEKLGLTLSERSPDIEIWFVPNRYKILQCLSTDHRNTLALQWELVKFDIAFEIAEVKCYNHYRFTTGKVEGGLVFMVHKNGVIMEKHNISSTDEEETKKVSVIQRLLHIVPPSDITELRSENEKLRNEIFALKKKIQVLSKIIQQ
jgi:hypothetical protein